MDFLQELQAFLFRRGYRMIEYDQKLLWIKEEDNRYALIEIIPELLLGQTAKPVAKQEEEIHLIENEIMIKYQKRVERLTLMVFKGAPQEKQITELDHYPNIWYLDRQDGILFIYERQINEFFGLKKPLEEFMQGFLEKKKTEDRKELHKMITPLNTGIVAVNIIVFCILMILGDVEDPSFMASHGALYYGAIAQGKEYYRLFTSMFLHFGPDHLLQNMIILMVMGCRLERIMGRGRYGIIYAVAGLGASLSSLFFTLAKEPYTVSAGASGAIFGVMGGLLLLILKDVIQKKRRSIDEIGIVGIIFMIVMALSYGFFETGVDNAAHIGGLITGFFITGILSSKAFSK